VIFDKVKEGDFFNISQNETEDAIEDIFEAIFGTIKDCRFYTPVYDFLQWCGDNTDQCIHKKDLLQRLWDNGQDIGFMAYDLYHIST
jgi:hypothetical protein